MRYVVDTHAWLRFLAGHSRLGAAARTILQGQENRSVLPAMAYAEACWIVEHGRVPTLSVADVQAALDADARFSVYPLDQGVIDKSQGLTAIREMHDRQIVATALALADTGEQAALLTHDADITASGLVPVVW